MESPPIHAFPEHCRRSIQGLQGALLELYRAVGADPTRPQDVSRQYHLNKNLTWKVAKIISATDTFEAVPVIPGAGGFDILLEKMSKAGAPQTAISRVRDAAEEFDRMIEIHTGDRGALELALDSMGGGAKPLEVSRKLAFRGNSGIWGIQAGVRVSTHFLSPNPADPSILDLAIIGGLTRIRRLRSIDRWPVFQLRSYDDLPTSRTRGERRALEPSPGDQPSDPWLMRSFCDGPLPEIHLRQAGETTIYEIGEGPIGRTGEFSCFFGFADIAAVPRYRDETNHVGEFIASVSLPLEAFQFDLLIDEQLTEVASPELQIIGTIGGALDSVGSTTLPLPERFRDLGVGAMLDTPLVDRYSEVVATMFKQLGRDPSRFRCLRLVIECPPLSSRIAVRYRLPEGPPA